MPSKKSEPQQKASSPWKGEFTCSELELHTWVKDQLLPRLFAAFSRTGQAPLVVLTGAMGAGKSTFARACLEHSQLQRAPQGSPTFALAHEYPGNPWPWLHVDLYRLKDPSEITESGIEESIWESHRGSLIEWADQFPNFHAALLSARRPVCEIALRFLDADAEKRVLTFKLRD